MPASIAVTVSAMVPLVSPEENGSWAVSPILKVCPAVAIAPPPPVEVGALDLAAPPVAGELGLGAVLWEPPVVAAVVAGGVVAVVVVVVVSSGPQAVSANIPTVASPIMFRTALLVMLVLMKLFPVWLPLAVSARPCRHS